MTDVTEAAPSKGSTSGQRHLGWALVLICVAQLMVVLDSTIANIALPFIQKDLDVTPANLQWVVTGYALAFGGLLLLGGRLGDLYGRRRVFMIGVVIFAIASGVGGLAQSELMLLSSRAFQGLGAAIASPTALALITTTFPAGPSRNRAFSVYAMMSGAGAAVGLILGGWLTGLHPHIFGTLVDGWRLTFLINVPIGLAAAFLAPRVLSESESHPGELDLPGAFTGTLGLASLVYGITKAGQADKLGHSQWTAPHAMIPILVGIGLLAAFVAIERSVKHPLLPFRILTNRTRATAFVTMMIVPAAMFAMFFFLSQFVQNVVGYSPLRAGFSFLPFSFGIVIGATVSSKLMTRIDPRYIAGIGTAFAGLALLMFSRLSIDDSPSAVLKAASSAHGFLGGNVNYWTDLFPFIVLMSIGMGMTFVPMTLTAVHGVGAKDSGIGSGVLNTMQQVGGALGLATLSTIALHFITEKSTHLFAAVSAIAPASGPVDPAFKARLGSVITRQAAFTDGSVHAFLAGAFMMWVASVIVWIFLNVKASEMATDGAAPEGVHVG